MLPLDLLLHPVQRIMHRMPTFAFQSCLVIHYQATEDSMPRTLMVDSRKDFVHHSWGSLEHRLQLQSDSEISRNVAYLTTMIRASKA